MKEILNKTKRQITITGLIIVIMFLFSYKNTNNSDLTFGHHVTYNLPVKQRDVIVTYNYSEMKKLIRKGYVVEDVDLSFNSPNNFESIYTLVLY